VFAYNKNKALQPARTYRDCLVYNVLDTAMRTFATMDTGGSKEGAGGAMPPPAAWASTQNALKVAIFRPEIEKMFWGGGSAPSPDPS